MMTGKVTYRVEQDGEAAGSLGGDRARAWGCTWRRCGSHALFDVAHIKHAVCKGRRVECKWA